MRGSKRSIRVMQLRRVLDLTSLVEIPGVSPRTIQISGNRLDMASAVELNNTEAPSFAAISPSRLLVQVPPGVRGWIREAAVFSDYLDPGGRAVASYDFSNHPRLTDGKYRVLQNYVKLLLTTPGTDIFSPNVGGGLRKLLYRNADAHSENAISAEIETRAAMVARQIIENQTMDPTISAKERLLSATISKIVVTASDQTVTVDVALKFHDGERVSTIVGW